MSRVFSNVLQTIGKTPVVRLNRIRAANDCTIYAKLEYFNPLSSVKGAPPENLFPVVVFSPVSQTAFVMRSSTR